MIILNDDIQKIIKQFEHISNKQWIPSISKSFGSIGPTFEKELQKNRTLCIFRIIMASK